MAIDDLTAALDEIRVRIFVGNFDDAPRLLAALDEVLKGHHRDAVTPDWCGGCGFSWPCSTVQAISRALLMPIRSAG